MPSAGIHGITGLLCSGCVVDPYCKLGMVVGSLLPDCDLLVSAVVYLFTKDINIGKKIHRNWSHSCIIHLGFAGVACLFFIFFPNIAKFILVCAGMMTIHSIFDYFYIGYMTNSDAQNKIEPGIAFLSPISAKKWAFFPKVFSDKVYSIWMALDFLFDPILPSFFIALAWKYQTNTSIITFVSIITIFFTVIFLMFLIFACISRNINANRFTIAIHYPGLLFFIFILVVPFLFWPTLSKLYFF